MNSSNSNQQGQSFVDQSAAPPIFSMQEILTVVFKDGKRILYAFCIPFLLAVIVSFIPKVPYTSDASLLVELGHEYVYMADSSGASGNGGSTPLAFEREQALNAESQIITSRDLIRQVVTEIGIKQLYPSIDRQKDKALGADLAVQAFGRNLDAEALKDSNVINVHFNHADPAVAERALQTLINQYLERRRSIFSNADVTFLSKQVDAFRVQLHTAEQQLEAFKKKYGIVNYDQQIALMLQQVNELETQLNQSNQQVATADARVQSLKQIVRKVPANLTQYSETSADVLTPPKLLELRLKEQDLSGRYVDANPLVVNARKDAATAAEFMRDQKVDPPKSVRIGRNPVRDAAEQDLMRAASDEPSLQAGRAALRTRLDSLKAQAAVLSSRQAEYAAMNREQKLLEDSYIDYSKKLEAARITEVRDQQGKANVSILQAASRPLAKKNVQLLIIIIGFFLSAAVALIVAFLSEALRPSFLSAAKLERTLGVPVLATLPMVERS